MSQSLVAPTQSIEEVVGKIVNGFQFLDDWTARYEYLIDLGRAMPPFPDDQRIEENRLYGCQAQVWLLSQYHEGRLYFQAASDSAIVSGLLALLLRVYSGRTPQEIIDHPPEFICEIELEQHLSLYRANGLAQMMKKIRLIAEQTLIEEEHGAL